MPENAPAGYVVGDLETIDPDFEDENQTFTYTIVTDPHNMFKIEKDKLIVRQHATPVRVDSLPCNNVFVHVSFVAVDRRQSRRIVHHRA
jgi:hypothetical protein